MFCFIKPILGNRFVRSRGFIVSEPKETHPRSEIADVPTSPCPPFDNLGYPDPLPPGQTRNILNPHSWRIAHRWRCSNKVARTRLARRHSRNSCHIFVCIVVCACSRHALDFKILRVVDTHSYYVCHAHNPPIQNKVPRRTEKGWGTGFHMRSLFKRFAKIQSWQGVRAIATASAGPSIPIIDIGPFLEQTGSSHSSRRQQQQQQTAAAMGVACEHVGFFYVKNHGVDAELLQGVQHMARRFFAENTAEKFKYRQVPQGVSMGRGYQQVRGGSA